ncbi:hypothetical protein [Streptomyces sp. NPDC059460]
MRRTTRTISPNGSTAEGSPRFPDDLDLLAAYAQLCLNCSPFDRPAR